MEHSTLLRTASEAVSKSAAITPDGVYRYDLVRDWRLRDAQGGLAETPHYALLIGLNPSTADDKVDDQTIRREMDFVRTWGYNMLVKCNLFGLRSTDPRGLREVADPVGASNDEILLWWARDAALILACWGIGCYQQMDYTKHHRRDDEVVAKLRDAGLASKLHHLGLTKHGYPKHPLYLPKGLTPQPWSV